jgi:hypothetical protein
LGRGRGKGEAEEERRKEGGWKEKIREEERNGEENRKWE